MFDLDIRHRGLLNDNSLDALIKCAMDIIDPLIHEGALTQTLANILDKFTSKACDLDI